MNVRDQMDGILNGRMAKWTKNDGRMDKIKIDKW